MNDITRVGLTANQLKNQFPSMAMKTVAASLQKELPMTLSGVQIKELNTTLQNAAYSKEMLAEISLPDLIKFESELFENEIGRSCYYFADTKEGALTEVYKH